MDFYVETLAGYFGTIDESMSYEQVMKRPYKSMQNKDVKITQLSQEKADLKQELDNLNKPISSDNLKQKQTL